jgi:hypothetical protein
MLTDDQVRDLLIKFKKSKAYSISHENRVRSHEFNSKWIRPDTIQELPDEELREKFLEYYKGGEGRQRFNQIYRDRIIKDVSLFRKTLLYLLDETVPIEQRFQSVVEGAHHIDGFGKGLASSLLMDFDIERYCIWNNKTEMGLNVLGWKVYDNNDDVGLKYVKVLNALKRLRDEINPELNLTFDDVDFFLHFISAEEEGVRLVKKITGDEEITISTPAEECIQKIIEANFDEVIGNKLGLKLYEDDPENSGSQYQTGVGYIDFLTVDKENGDFVVVELKRGMASDDALAQVLRYIGWVKENLANGRNVRGLILAEGKDEKLKYALKSVSDVKVLRFKISIQIEEQ